MVETFWWLVSSVKTYHSVADVLKKVEKTSSENNSLSIFPKQSLRRRGSYGLGKDAYEVAARRVARHFEQ